MRRLKLEKKLRIKAIQEEREAAELCQREAEAEAARLVEEEAHAVRVAEEAEAARLAEEQDVRVREEEEAAAAAAATTVALEPEHVLDAESKVCRLRARHMLKEKRWLKCKSCRTFMQQVAVRLSHADLDEENLKDMERVLVI
jgi:hypothetical protein